MAYVTWVTTIASLVGVWLNIRKERLCFAVWLCSNVSWSVIDAYHGIWGQALLQAVYAVMSVYGWYSWSHAGS